MIELIAFDLFAPDLFAYLDKHPFVNTIFLLFNGLFVLLWLYGFLYTLQHAKRRSFAKAAQTSLSTPGYFAAYAARRTVISTLCIFIITTLLKIRDNLILLKSHSVDIDLIVLCVTLSCIALGGIVIIRLSEIYIVSGVIVKRGTRK